VVGYGAWAFTAVEDAMDRIRMAKNAALLMIASLLTRETLFLKNVPRLADVTLLGRILGNHGVDITAVGKKVGQSTIDGQTFKLKAAEYRGEAPQVRGGISSGSLPSQHASSQTGVQKRHDVP
jgi:UDP-N-acetylglucosamine enolpyruvyl transferase